MIQNDLPRGFLYQPDFLSAEEEQELLAAVRLMDLRTFEMHGVTSRRRVAHFGWLYGYNDWRLTQGPPIPPELTGVRARLAQAVAVQPESLAEALVTEYPPGAGIGWHRDAPMFGIVLAVSLAGTCRLRFQRGKDADRQVLACELQPRSMYCLDGEARSAWQHSIPPAKELRYSITFRAVRRT